MLLKSYPTIITHSVSAGALLCDATTANAFIAPTDIDFTPYRGKQIEIWSGSTLWARAWVSGTAPSGDGAGAELLDSELVTNGGMETGDPPTGWTPATGTLESNAVTVHSGSASAKRTRDTSGATYQTIATVIGGLYLPSMYGYAVSGQSTATYLGGSIGSYADFAWVSIISNTTLDSWQSILTYRTALTGSVIIVAGVSGEPGAYGFLDDVSCKRVLDPAPTGALLLSSNGGSRGWAYKHASFNPNAAVTLRILARRIASGNGGYYK